MLGLALNMRNHKYGYAYDYKNFNFQHSNKDMRAFYNLIREIGVTVGNDFSWLRGILWLMESVERTFTGSEGEADFKKAMRGLLSGVRATNGINTVLKRMHDGIPMLHAERGGS